MLGRHLQGGFSQKQVVHEQVSRRRYRAYFFFLSADAQLDDFTYFDRRSYNGPCSAVYYFTFDCAGSVVMIAIETSSLRFFKRRPRKMRSHPIIYECFHDSFDRLELEFYVY